MLNDIFAKYVKPASKDDSLINESKCEKCGGNCCKTMGCHISPFDLKEVSTQSIIDFIDETGCVSIDWWEGNPATGEQDGTKSYYLRVKNAGSNVIDPAYLGKCSILTDKGCSLSFEYRPKGARELIPEEPECRAAYSKQQCAIDWLQYADILENVFDYYVSKGEVTEVDVPAFEGLIEMLLGL